MKTLTEFAPITLKNALKTKQELTAAGKTAEELPAAMGETLKLEGDKLGFIMTALDLAETRLEGLKRVLVMSLAEGENKPSDGVEKDGKIYLVEHDTAIATPGARDERGGGRDGKRGGGRDGKRGGGGGRDAGRGGGGPGRGGDRDRGGPGGDRAPRAAGDRGAPRALPPGSKPGVITPRANPTPVVPAATDAAPAAAASDPSSTPASG